MPLLRGANQIIPKPKQTRNLLPFSSCCNDPPKLHPCKQGCAQNTWSVGRRQTGQSARIPRIQEHFRNFPKDGISDTKPSLGEDLRQVQLRAPRGAPAGFPLREPRSNTALLLRRGEKNTPRKKKIMKIQNSSSHKEQIKCVTSRKLFSQMWKETQVQ